LRSAGWMKQKHVVARGARRRVRAVEMEVRRARTVQASSGRYRREFDLGIRIDLHRSMRCILLRGAELVARAGLPLFPLVQRVVELASCRSDFRNAISTYSPTRARSVGPGRMSPVDGHGLDRLLRAVALKKRSCWLAQRVPAASSLRERCSLLRMTTPCSFPFLLLISGIERRSRPGVPVRLFAPSWWPRRTAPSGQTALWH